MRNKDIKGWNMLSKIKQFRPEITGSLLCLALGILSGYSVKAADSLWYMSLIKPTFNPPPWVFGPVWTILYLMMGAALGILWKDKLKNGYLILIFTMQFILNLLWSPIFFYYQNISLALIDICALWILLIFLVYGARNQRPIMALISPYLFWVTFALLLNISIYQMNVI